MEENKKLKSILESNHVDYKDDGGKNIGLKEDNNIMPEVTEDLQSGAVFFIWLPWRRDRNS